jgi:hypothetical protein
MAIYVGSATYSESTINQNTGAFGDGFTLNGNLTVANSLRAAGQPSFYATGTAATWIYSSSLGGTAWREMGSQLGWTSTQTGAGSYGFNNGTGRYTAPLEGNYYFYAQSYYYNDNNSTSGYIHYLLNKNGSEAFNQGGTPYNIYGHGAVANHVDGIHVHAIIYLSVGDYVSIRPYWGGGVGRLYSDYQLFTGMYLGVY